MIAGIAVVMVIAIMIAAKIHATVPIQKIMLNAIYVITTTAASTKNSGKGYKTMLTNSYVISDKATGKAIFETFQKSVADKINTNKYIVETAHKYLVRVNKELTQ